MNAQLPGAVPLVNVNTEPAVDMAQLGPTKNHVGYLLELNLRERKGGAVVYAGTVPAHVVARRRAANKAARRSRRINRGGAR